MVQQLNGSKSAEIGDVCDVRSIFSHLAPSCSIIGQQADTTPTLGGLMSRISRYEVVGAKSLELLVELVQSNISEGWQPLGGPFYFNGTHHQAMVWIEATDEDQHKRGSHGGYQSDIELIEELTEDDQPISRWETGVNDGRRSNAG
jgi:hypothetical protein